jgi:two-component system OmpR family sensor kinase
MKGGRWNSVRVRLTVWNMAILTLALTTLGVTICFIVQSWMHRSVDQDLAQRLRRFREGDFHRRNHEPPGFPREARRPGPPARGRDFPPFLNEPRLFPASAPRGPFPQGPLIAKALQDWPDDPETKRAASLQFGRGFDAWGNPWNPRADLAWDPRPLPAALAGREQYTTVTVEGVRLRALTGPLHEGERITGAIQFATDLRGFDRLWRSLVATLLALLPLSLVGAGLGGLFLSNRALRPVHEITQAAARIGAADLSQRLEVSAPDEFGELAETFNGMIDRLEQAFRRQEDAFEEQRRFTADASHELRTPLARIKASVTLALMAERPAAEYRRALRVVNDAAEVMNRLVQDLLLLARGDADRLPLDLQPLDVASLFEAVAVPQGIAPRLEIELPGSLLAVVGHQGSLTRLLTNLIENARRHTPEDGRITVSARAERDAVIITVADTGEGIPPEHLPHVCERFYRVDAARSRDAGGAGLGLAICQSIAHAHGGRLEIESEVGRGTIVHVTLRCSPIPDAARAGRPALLSRS